MRSGSAADFAPDPSVTKCAHQDFSGRRKGCSGCYGGPVASADRKGPFWALCRAANALCLAGSADHRSLWIRAVTCGIVQLDRTHLTVGR